LRMQAKKSGNPLVAVHRGADGDDGYVVYGVRYPDFVTTPTAGSVLNVLDLHTGSAETWSGLWRFLFGVDLVDEINTWQRPLDEPVEMLLHDPRAARTTRLSDATWLRLGDVPTALAART